MGPWRAMAANIQLRHHTQTRRSVTAGAINAKERRPTDVPSSLRPTPPARRAAFGTGCSSSSCRRSLRGWSDDLTVIGAARHGLRLRDEPRRTQRPRLVSERPPHEGSLPQRRCVRPVRNSDSLRRCWRLARSSRSQRSDGLRGRGHIHRSRHARHLDGRCGVLVASIVSPRDCCCWRYRFRLRSTSTGRTISWALPGILIRP